MKPVAGPLTARNRLPDEKEQGQLTEEIKVSTSPVLSDASYTLADVTRAIESIQRLDDTNEKLESIDDDLYQFGTELHRIADALGTIAKPKPPVGWWAMVLARIDRDSDPIHYASGKVIAFYPETSTYWLTDFLGETFEIRPHGHDGDDPDTDEVLQPTYYATEDQLVAALKAQHAREYERFKATGNQRSLGTTTNDAATTPGFTKSDSGDTPKGPTP